MLYIDIGNTRAKYTTLAGAHFTDIQNVLNENISISWLDKHWGQYHSLTVINVSHDSVINLIKEWAHSYHKPIQVIESEERRNGVLSGYHKPKSLGVDRWIALQGAFTLFPKQNVLIIDAGTATTIDYLTKNGTHQGGWIFPGISALFNTVLKNTAKVEANYQSVSKLCFGRDTNEGLSQASIVGTIGLIEQAIKQANSLGDNLCLDHLILTGGNAQLLSKHLEIPHSVEPYLLFHGMSQYTL